MTAVAPANVLSGFYPAAEDYYIPSLFTPGPVREWVEKRNKPLSAGLRVEERIVALANDVYGSVCWRRPGVSSLVRNTGDGYLPDAVGALGLLGRYTDYLMPDREPEAYDRQFNFILSVKSQNSPGSAKQKILTEISDLAGVCDDKRIVAAVVLQGAFLDAGLVAAAKRQGKREMVAVLTKDELADGFLLKELLTVAKRRAQLYRKVGPRGGLPPKARNSEQDWAYANRRAARLASRQARKTALFLQEPARL